MNCSTTLDTRPSYRVSSVWQGATRGAHHVPKHIRHHHKDVSLRSHATRMTQDTYSPLAAAMGAAYLVPALLALAVGCDPVQAGDGQRAHLTSVPRDPAADLAAATSKADPFALVRRDDKGGASFESVRLTALHVEGVGTSAFATAHGDTPTILGIEAQQKLIGYTAGNHVELPLSASKPTTMLEPSGYPLGSELKLWVTQDSAGSNALLWQGSWIDGSGKGLAPLHVQGGGVDYYHAYLRSSGEWWVEQHQ